MKVKRGPRKKIAENNVYSVFFDYVQWGEQAPIENYLVVEPFNAAANEVTSVTILPKVKDDFLLIKTYRHAINRESYEFPKGFVEIGENDEQAAIRELKEETGMLAKSMQHLLTMAPSVGLVKAYNSIFVANDCEQVASREDTDFGHLEVKSFSGKELNTMIDEGEVVDAFTILAWYRYLLKAF